MILGWGLFQADGHPGNILVMKRGKVGLIDFGQSKQLSGAEQRQIAQMMIALCQCAALDALLPTLLSFGVLALLSAWAMSCCAHAYFLHRLCSVAIAPFCKLVLEISNTRVAHCAAQRLRECAMRHPNAVVQE